MPEPKLTLAPSPPPSALRAWLDITRISNAPTLVSNVAAGLCLATGTVDPAMLGLISLSLLCTYSAGMILNDICDEAVDRRERPERPLPSGRLSRRAAIQATVTLFIIGLLLLASFPKGMAAGIALIGLIFVYNWRHKVNPVAPLVMGACRSMIYVIAALCATGTIPGQIQSMGGLLMLYVATVTWLARDESNVRATPSRLAALGALWIPVLMLGISVHQPVALILNLVFLIWVTSALRILWLRPDSPVGPSIGKLLAAICLFDAVLVATCDVTWVAVPILAMAAVTVLHRYIKGT
jgi:4-hydroxybenzoate polyprenyltransferase